MNSKIFSLRKSKMGLVSVAIAFLWIGTGMNMETAMAEETDATALATQLESTESSLTNTVSENAEAEEVTDEVPSEEKKSEEMEDMEEELPFIENHLEVAPIQAGDQTISGNTTPGGYVAITIDGEAITSIENILEADDKGDFSYRLSKPLAHSQTVEISALPKQFWTLEADSEERKVVVRTNRHPEAYEIPAKRLEKTSNGMHQVFIEPVFEHTSKVIGHTSVKGSVYLSINGSFVSDKTLIDPKDGRFEVTFSESLAGSKFKADDRLVLSFVSEDGQPVITNTIVKPLVKEKVSSQMTVKPLSSATSVLEGTTFPLGRVHLYNADTSEFIMEAIADETGHYKIALPALQSEDKYYRLTHNQQEDLVSVHLDTVDGSSILLDKSVMASLATYLQDADMDEATDEDPIIVPKLHNKKDYIVGRTIHLNAYVRMVSSIKGKQYPPVQVDELGFFGFQIQDLQLPFEKGERIRFEIIDPVTNNIIASKEEVVGQYLEDEDVMDLPFQVEKVTTDHGYISGKTAPDVMIELVSTQNGEEIIGKTSTDSTGRFEFDLGSRVLKNGETLSFRAFDKEGEQVAWEVVTVQKGNGHRINKPDKKDEKEEQPSKEITKNIEQSDTLEQTILPPVRQALTDKKVEQNAEISKEETVSIFDDSKKDMPTKQEKMARTVRDEGIKENVSVRTNSHDSGENTQVRSLPKTGEKTSLVANIMLSIVLFLFALFIGKKKITESE